MMHLGNKWLLCRDWPQFEPFCALGGEHAIDEASLDEARERDDEADRIGADRGGVVRACLRSQPNLTGRPS